MRFYLMIKVGTHVWQCLHIGNHGDCMNKGMELGDDLDWMVCQEVRYSSGKETFTT